MHSTMKRTLLLMAVASSLLARTVEAVENDQATLYQLPNATGSFKTLSTGGYPAPAWFSPVPDNSVLALEVGAGSRVMLAADPNYGGWQNYFDGGWTFYGLSSGASAVRVFPREGGPMAAWYVGNYPSGSYTWSNEVQGLAHDDSNWFITQPKRLWKIPLTSDLNSDTPVDSISVSMPEALAGYDHFGDLDYFSFFSFWNYLFVPVTGSGKQRAIAVFNPVDLSLVTWTTVPELGTSGGGWLAMRAGAWPNDYGTLWVSSDAIDGSHPVWSYKVDFTQLNRGQSAFLTNPRQVFLTDQDNNPVTDMYSMQGGVFNESGSLLYTSNGYCDTPGWIHVYAISDTGGRLQGRSTNPALSGSAPFAFEQHPVPQSCFAIPFWKIKCYCTGEEPEGLDYFDATGRNIPGVTEGSLHALLLSNDGGDDHVWLKHYTY